MSFLTELRRRNVFKVGAAYLALAWLVLQLTSIVVPEFGLPAWTMKFVIWFGVIGFPCVLLFAWAYELTPEGLKRESEVDRSESITQVTGKRLEYIIIALLVVAIGLFLLQYSRPPAPAAHSTATEVVGTPATATSVPAEPPAKPQPAPILPDEKSIAVLPFVNMSPDKDQEYFSDGMSEELLNLLAQVPELKVIARTSSFAFKGKDVPIAEIARQLNVAHVLEGSVRKSGNTVRITAQLVRAADSTHLWSHTYDRPMDDIFKVQDEIANAIVQALQIRLAGGELSRRKGGTQNLESYQLLLRAWNEDWLSRSSLDAAQGYLEQAVKLDPGHGMAWSALASLATYRAEFAWIDPAVGFEHARQLAQHAFQLSPDQAHTHFVLFKIHLVFDWDWAAAEAEERRALAIAPRDPILLAMASRLSSTLGHWDDAERQLRAAVDRNPLDALGSFFFGTIHYRAGRFVESEGMYRRALDLAPHFPYVRPFLAKTLLAQGKAEAAVSMVQQEADENARLIVLPVVLQAAGRQAEADEALQALISHWADISAYNVAYTYAYRGDHNRAMEWLERAYRQRDTELSNIVGEPLFKSIAKDTRFIAFLKKMNLPTEPVPVNWQ